MYTNCATCQVFCVFATCYTADVNIHPLLVHFPIALLVTYSVLELGAYLLPALRRQAWVSPVKTFLLFAGVLAAFVALVTGGMAEEIIEEAGRGRVSPIVETHSSFATATTLLYLILAAAYLVRIFDEKGWRARIVGTNNFLAQIWNFKKRFWYAVLNTPLLPLLALLALVSITITGALGAAIVYGPNVDPFVSLIYHLFWI